MSSVVSSQDSIDTTVHIQTSLTNNDDSYLAQPKPARVSGKLFTSLEEAETSTDDVPMTPRHGYRREGFDWGVPSGAGFEQKHSRDPMLPAPLETRTPPPLHEIIRSMTLCGNNSVGDLKLQRVDSIESEDISPQVFTSSTVGDGLQRSDTRRSSLAAFARGVARHVPDMRMFTQLEKVADRKAVLARRDSQDAESISNGGKKRKSSITLPSMLKSSHSYETALKATPIIETLSQPSTTTSTIQAPSKGTLRDRRKVKLDLSLPSEMPDLPVRSRPPAIALSSITPSRPRSPKTPWVRNEPPSWDLKKLPRSAPIMEEGYMQQSIMGSGNAGSVGLLPDSDAIISSQSPRFERPSLGIRDRRYIPRPAHHRNHSGRSGTSDTLPARAPDANPLVPLDARALQEQNTRTAQELQKLSQTTRPGRQRRRWWKSSSDEGLQTPEPTTRGFSLHLFKRPARYYTPGTSDTRTSCSASSSSWCSRQVTPAQPPLPSLAGMAAPPPFVPPGLNRVPTPPMFDADRDIKGKLADFFFDVHGTNGLRRKTPGTRGIWDSDALLMSVSTDLTSSDSEEQEGPEGPIVPPTSLDFNDSAPLPPGVVLGPVLGGHKWFGVETGAAMPDEQALTYLALQEEEAQRKFEWLVPEHLPSSPLCPLHVLYRGPCKGVCYWHGPRVSGASRRSSRNKEKEKGSGEVGRSWDIREMVGGGQAARRGSRGWRVGKFDQKPVKEEGMRRSRLASLEAG